MTSSTAIDPAPARRGSAAWWFRSPDGRLVLAQWPNPAIVVWMVTIVLGWFDLSADDAAAVENIGHGALLVWALDELVRGAAPYRRVLGAVVLAFQVAAVVLG